MATTFYVQRGESLDYVNAGEAKIEAGEVVVIGTKIGIAAGDIEVGAKGALHVEGVFEMPLASGETVGIGAAVYWNGSAVTATAGSNTLAGYAAAAPPEGATKVLVKINA